MKHYLAILMLSTVGLRADVEFSGFFITSQEALFSLTDTEDHRSSGWLKIGQSFRGYTVVSFDAGSEVITLKRDERSLTRPIRASKVKDGKATIGGTIKFQNEELDGVRATLFFGEESVFPLKNGVTFRIKPESLPDGNILYRAKFVATGEDGAERTLSAPSVVAIPGKSFGIQIGDFGYSFTP
ncbi:MAG: hypothetical protein Q7S40_30940 [Opitutaceae bacterium]|nr:hypothetical protein [Opitutaceae bacterium]